MRPFLILVIFLSGSIGLQAQLMPHKGDDHSGHDHNKGPAPAPEKIEWSKSKKLSWKDYKGKYDNTRPKTLMSFISTFYNHFQNKKGDSVIVEVMPVFYPKDSYVKPEVKTKLQLEHEQALFDLYEVWARKLRRDFLKTEFAVHSFSSYMQAMYKANLAARNQEIFKYNNETKNGGDAAKQKEWTAKIQKELTELQAYSNNTIRIKIK